MELEEFTVHDRLGPVTITGALLSDQRYGSETKPRWTDLALYRIVETRRSSSYAARGEGPDRLVLETNRRERPFRYALEIIARSWVYHDADGTCVKERHAISVVADVRMSGGRWRSLYPCPTCKPADLENMRPDDRIAEERQDTHLYLCSDANAVIKRLYRHSGEISVLAAKLLHEASTEDRNIAEALRRMRRI